MSGIGYAQVMQLGQHRLAHNVARYLEHASLEDLLTITEGLLGECSARGIQVARPLAEIVARLEYRIAEQERAS